MPDGRPPHRGDVLSLTTPQVVRFAHVHAKTLDYWSRDSVGVVTPSVLGSRGRRRDRLWSPDDAVRVRAVVGLRAAGCPLSYARLLPHLPQSDSSDDHARLLALWCDGVQILMTTLEEAVVRQRRDPANVQYLVPLPLHNWRAEAQALATVRTVWPPGGSQAIRQNLHPDVQTSTDELYLWDE